MGKAVDIWEWTYADMKRLREEGASKKAIVDNYQLFWDAFHNDAITAELAINEALDAARTTGEIRWELHLRHWRLQLWLTQDRLREILPEAIDLLSLAIDERVKDIPQRICAYHDIVECYVQMDAAGYCEEITENALDILAQLPKRHSCADCARGNMARSLATAGRAEEARHWLAEHEANRYERRYPGLVHSQARTSELLQEWEKAERYYLEACEVARKEENGAAYQEALIGVARARLGKGDIDGAQKILLTARKSLQYEGETNLLALLLEVEGAVAEAHGVHQAALGYFIRAAKLQYGLGRYRDAAKLALHAAELGRTQELPAEEIEIALEISAKAVGQMPPASQDVRQRLETLGLQPAKPEETLPQPASTIKQDQAAEAEKERATIVDILQSHVQSGNAHGMVSMLFRLGIWHNTHNEPRAAVDYFIWSAALERLMKFPRHEREDALAALKHVRGKLPTNAVEAALKAAESAPPTQLLPMLTDLAAEQWQWTLQAIATEITGKPVVEPEPINKNARLRFEEMIEHNASMTALLVRFHAQADASKREAWIAAISEGIQQMEEQIVQSAEEENPKELLSFMHGLVALSRGASIAEVQPTVLAPFAQVIAQIGKISELSVWQHPGNSPLDFMIEQAAQKAVRALRLHDEHRASRLANLAFRYELMTIDMREHQELENEVRYLDALIALLQKDGQPLPTREPALAEPYSTILAAVTQAGQEKSASEAE